MDPLRGRSWRFRRLIPEGWRFAVVGLAGVVIVLAGADVLRYEVGLSKYASVTIAIIAGAIPNFAGNRYWTFRHRQRSGVGREAAAFLGLNGLGLLVQYACIWCLQDALGLPGRLWYTGANLLGIGLGTIFRFWSYRRWVWQEPLAVPAAGTALTQARPDAAAVPKHYSGPGSCSRRRPSPAATSGSRR